MIFPPTVILTRSGSAFCGLNSATTRAYVTVLPLGTYDFFMNSIVSVPVLVLVPTPFASCPNSFTILDSKLLLLSDIELDRGIPFLLLWMD